MGYSKRLLLVSIAATFANLGIFVVWVALSSGLPDLDKIFDQPLGEFLFFYGIAFLITAFGLSFLILIASRLLSRASNRVLAIPTFIALGGLLGWGMFAWAPDPMAFALCGAISALIGALVMPDLFGPVPEKLAQESLAD